MRIGVIAGIFVLSLPAVGLAEVKSATASAMLIEHRYTISSTPAAAWEALVHPERYWPNDHTWSGDARNMVLEPTATGCFCERWKDGSADHGHVVMAVPGKLLRLHAALGPFQQMAVSGVLTVQLVPKDAGTEATVTYRVSGDPSHGLDAMAPVVDKVIDQQFSGFVKLATEAR